MKVTLAFADDEQDNAHMAMHVVDYSLIIYEWEDVIRQHLKHEDLTEEQYKVWEDVHDLWYQLKADRGIPEE